METEKKPNFKRLRIIQIAAVSDAILILIVSLFLLNQFEEPELAWIILSLAFAGITFGAIFYFGCLFFEGSLQQYIKEDRTVIKSETVEMATDTHASGDPEIDEWVNRYVFARNLFGMSIIPLMILGGLWVFA